MQIFVAGATGVVGRRLVPLLVAAGHKVTAVARTDAKRRALELQGASPVAVQLFDAEMVARAAAGELRRTGSGARCQGVEAHTRMDVELTGSLGETLGRSQRVSNARFKAASGWAPRVPSVLEGWPLLVEELADTEAGR